MTVDMGPGSQKSADDHANMASMATNVDDSDVRRIPVSESQWLASQNSLLESVRLLGTDRKAPDLRGAVTALAHDLSAIGWFACTDLEAVKEATQVVDDVLRQGELTSKQVSALSSELLKRSNSFENRRFSTDPWEELFGVPRVDLTDAAGSVVSSRLLARYYQRPAELAKAAGALIFLARAPLTLSVQLGPTLVSLLETPNPLWTFRAMALMQERLHGLRPEIASAKLGAFYERGDQAWTSSRTFNTITKMVDSVSDPRTRTALRLDAYRKLAEGQLRAWLWLLLDDSDTNERAPMLAGLSRRVSNDPRALVRQVSTFLKPAWRNASAHEDVRFDEHDRLIDEDGTVVEPAEIWRRTGDALAFTAGCEAGLANYPTIEEVPAERASLTVPRSFQIRRTYEWFGDNGLLVKSVEIDKGTLLRVSVEEIGLNQIDPCFQALIECAISGVQFNAAEILVSSSVDRALIVASQSVELTTEIWAQVRKFGLHRNPGSTFLPMHLENRMRAESQAMALDAIAWLALNDCLEAFDVAEDALANRSTADDKTLELIRQREASASMEIAMQKYLLRRLKIASKGFTLATKMVSKEPSPYTNRAMKAIERQLAETARNLRENTPSYIFPSWMLDLRDKIPAPPPAPTLGILDWSQEAQ